MCLWHALTQFLQLSIRTTPTFRCYSQWLWAAQKSTSEISAVLFCVGRLGVNISPVPYGLAFRDTDVKIRVATEYWNRLVRDFHLLSLRTSHPCSRCFELLSWRIRCVRSFLSRPRSLDEDLGDLLPTCCWDLRWKLDIVVPRWERMIDLLWLKKCVGSSEMPCSRSSSCSYFCWRTCEGWAGKVWGKLSSRMSMAML